MTRRPETPSGVRPDGSPEAPRADRGGASGTAEGTEPGDGAERPGAWGAYRYPRAPGAPGRPGDGSGAAAAWAAAGPPPHPAVPAPAVPGAPVPYVPGAPVPYGSGLPYPGPYGGMPVPPGTAAVAPYYWSEPPVKRAKGQAVGAFVLGLVGIVPGAVALGVVALTRIARRPQRGKGLAVAGLVLAGTWMLAGMVAVMAVAARTDGPSGTRRLSTLAPWTCYDQPASGSDAVHVVPCDQPHDRQLFATFDLSGGYPGLAAAQQVSEDRCERALVDGFVDPDVMKYATTMEYYYPEKPSWDAGDPKGWCVLKPTRGGKMTGSLRQMTSDYDAVQLYYLRVTRRTTLLRRELRGTQPSQWSRHRSIAAQLAAADRVEARELTADTSLFSGVIQQKADILAAADVGEARTADTLAGATSQRAWTSAFGKLRPGPITADGAAIRAHLGLTDL